MFLSSYTFKMDFLREQLFTSLRNSIIYFSPPPLPSPEGITVKDVCIYIYVRCAYSCVSSPFMYPSEIYTLQNSSSCLLINKILCSLISCLLFPVVSSHPSFLAAAALSRWLLLVYININQCLQRNDSPKHTHIKIQSWIFLCIQKHLTLSCTPQCTKTLMFPPNIIPLFMLRH